MAGWSTMGAEHIVEEQQLVHHLEVGHMLARLDHIHRTQKILMDELSRILRPIALGHEPTTPMFSHPIAQLRTLIQEQTNILDYLHTHHYPDNEFLNQAIAANPEVAGGGTEVTTVVKQEEEEAAGHGRPKKRARRAAE